MQNKKLSIRKMVGYLNDSDAEGGGFWLPNIQRPFVWTEEQIARLFDSIMRQYPISTLLVWKTKESVKHRRFIDLYHRDIQISRFTQPDHARSKCMVLDGQQRLQSLFVGLRGSYDGKELYFDVLSGAPAVPEDIRYRFAFKKSDAPWPWVRFKDIVMSKKMQYEIAQEITAKAPQPLQENQSQRVLKNIERAIYEFSLEDNLTYQELDGVDSPDTYRTDDIVEIFIRANSGGTKLGKSDLLFSLLTSSWDEAGLELEELLEDLNAGGFEFDRDFVLKCCLTILGRGARYEVDKFRDGRTREEIILHWQQISDAIRGVRDFLVNSTYIRSDKAMPSYLALIPLVYLRYHFPERFQNAEGLQAYLLRSLVTGVFGGNPDNLIDRLVRVIDDSKDFKQQDIYNAIRDAGRNLEITEDTIFHQQYGSRTVHLFFNLWYSSFDYAPALGSNGPAVDHIFPQSLLKKSKITNPETSRSVERYPKNLRDQIGNLMLLTAQENGAGGKTDAPPGEWFRRSRFSSDAEYERYLKLHLIPNDPALWNLERFDDFVVARQRLIAKQFAFMLRGEVNA